jgi:hypothetical protein
MTLNTGSVPDPRIQMYALGCPAGIGKQDLEPSLVRVAEASESPPFLHPL